MIAIASNWSNLRMKSKKNEKAKEKKQNHNQSLDSIVRALDLQELVDKERWLTSSHDDDQ